MFYVFFLRVFLGGRRSFLSFTVLFWVAFGFFFSIVGSLLEVLFSISIACCPVAFASIFAPLKLTGNIAILWSFCLVCLFVVLAGLFFGLANPYFDFHFCLCVLDVVRKRRPE